MITWIKNYFKIPRARQIWVSKATGVRVFVRYNFDGEVSYKNMDVSPYTEFIMTLKRFKKVFKPC